MYWYVQFYTVLYWYILLCTGIYCYVLVCTVIYCYVLVYTVMYSYTCYIVLYLSNRSRQAVVCAHYTTVKALSGPDAQRRAGDPLHRVIMVMLLLNTGKMHSTELFLVPDRPIAGKGYLLDEFANVRLQSSLIVMICLICPPLAPVGCHFRNGRD